MKDLVSGIVGSVDVGTAVIRNGNAATNGAGADLTGYNGAAVLFASGVLTDGSVACKVQESDDNSSWADAAAADIVGGSNAATLAATDDSIVRELGYIGKKRYIRGVMTQSGATTGGYYYSLIVRGFPVKAP